MTTPISLIVFSHLRWDFVFQRPQHVFSRLAAKRRVYFVEEPVHSTGDAGWKLSNPVAGIPGLTVCRPHTPIATGGFGDEQNAALSPLVAQLIEDHIGAEYDLWFQTPMAVSLADELAPQVVVYDKMDDLASFKFAPQGLRDREADLLTRADVVFTGGPSLYRATKDQHANCHCFPSSVDMAHFGKATGDLPDPPEQENVPRPRLGYFGVIDERFDLELLAATAAARPGWQFVMVGPVAKIDPADLPRLPNIHYAGQQAYERLPDFLAGWDVALLPFARNEATKMISPTKVLEYMAADMPIVSTRIADIVGPYGTMVGLGDTPAEFVAACEKAKNETPAERRRRSELYRDVLARTSWDATAAAMAERMEGCRTPDVRQTPAALRTVPILIAGAGPTGLSAAYHLGDDALLVEANERVGGWCRSLTDNGFTFDYAGHIMFSNDAYVHEMYAKMLGDNMHWQDREAWVYSKEVYTRYPFQGSLYGLPADIIKQCIIGAVEARYGVEKGVEPDPLPAAARKLPAAARNGKPHASGNGSVAGPRSFLGGIDPKDATLSDCCGDGIAEATTRLARRERPLTGESSAGAQRGTKPVDAPKNFEQFIYNVWGEGIAEHFAIPYNRKIWAVPLAEMETSWLGGRVPMPDLGEMIEGALTQKPKPMGPNSRFGYPLRGGFQALMDGFLPFVEERLLLNTRIVAVSPARRTATLSDGTSVEYRQLISTMPLPHLIRAMGSEVPAAVRDAVSKLRFTSVRCVNLGIGREKLTEKHWVYYPEDSVFHRIFMQGNASPHCNPPGGFGLTCEITYGPLKPLPCDGEALIQRCIDDCIKVGIIDEGDPVLTANQVDMPFAYVVYDHARAKNVAVIREWLEAHGIHLAGRYSEWEYYNSDHAFLAGKKTAELARAALTAPSPTNRVASLVQGGRSVRSKQSKVEKAS